MTGPGRPPIGPAVKVRLDPAMIAQIEARSLAECVSMAEIVRRLLRSALDADATR